MAYPFLKRLGIEKTNPGGFGDRWLGRGREMDVFTPINGKKIASVRQCTARDYEKIAAAAQEAFEVGAHPLDRLFRQVIDVA